MNHWIALLVTLAIGSIYISHSAPVRHPYQFTLNILSSSNPPGETSLAASMIGSKGAFNITITRYVRSIRTTNITLFTFKGAMFFDQTEKVTLLFKSEEAAPDKSLWMKVNNIKLDDIVNNTSKAFCTENKTSDEPIDLAHNQTVELFPCLK